MPTYEYKCPAGHVFEKFFATMNDDRWQKCPNCGQRAERLISGGTGLVFRGTGFYATDYKRGGEEKKESEKKEPQQGASKPSDSPKKPTDSGDK
jgi:putative FmdB family regulatory protein